MSGVTMARWLMPRQRGRSAGVVMTPGYASEGGFEDGADVGLAHRSRVGLDVAVAGREADDRVEVLLVDAAVGEAGGEAETVTQLVDSGGDVVDAHGRGQARRRLGHDVGVEADGVAQ